jgi:tetratricopeptide (TPR) repeat protein
MSEPIAAGWPEPVPIKNEPMTLQQSRTAHNPGRTPAGNPPRGTAPAAVEPGVVDLLAAGLAHHQAGRLAEAEVHYRRILAAAPDHADALHLLGVIAYQFGRLEIAIELIGRAVQQNGNDPSYYCSCGLVLQGLKRLDEAVASYDRALALKPDYVEALNNRGLALEELERFAEALESYDRALVLRPHLAEALNNRGNTLQALGRFAEALESYDRALALRPDLAEAHYNRGNTLQALGRFAEALKSYDRALALRPHLAEAYYNRGNTLQQLLHFAEALESYDRTLALRPDDAAALNNRGNVLRDLGRLEEAEACYRETLRLKPDYAEPRNNLGNVLGALGRLEEAEVCYREALSLSPDSPALHINLATLLLLAGRFEEGWREYEWRWQDKQPQPRKFTQPLWAGEETRERVLLLHAEQGFGDTIQFCRYVPLAASKASVILEVPRALAHLLSSLDGVERIVVRGDALPPFDLHCPLLSLPRAFGTNSATIPGKVPYVKADTAISAAWKRRLADLPGLRIGLVWAGSARDSRPATMIDRRRSITLGQFARLADVLGVSFVSLQKGDPASQTRSPPQGLVIRDWTEELEDFADTAALIEALDLVISVDTSVVHLAGALGRPVWLLNRFDTCWRWLLGRNDSPWYPTLRQFRQPKPGDWDSVLTEVREALTQLAAGRPELLLPVSSPRAACSRTVLAARRRASSEP